MKPLSSQIYGAFDDYVEVLVSVPERNSSLRVCVRFDKHLGKKQALQQADKYLSLLLAKLPEVERLA
jgi:hypothetical protein